MRKKLCITLITLAVAVAMGAPSLAFAQEVQGLDQVQAGHGQTAAQGDDANLPSGDCPAGEEASGSDAQVADDATGSDAAGGDDGSADGQAGGDDGFADGHEDEAFEVQPTFDGDAPDASEPQLASDGDASDASEPQPASDGDAGLREEYVNSGEGGGDASDDAAGYSEEGADAFAGSTLDRCETAVPEGESDEVRPSAATSQKAASAGGPAAEAVTPATAGAATAKAAKDRNGAVARKKTVSATQKIVSDAVAQGWYTVKSKLGAAFALCVRGTKTADGTAIELRKGKAAPGFAFKLKKAGGYYRIIIGIAPSAAVGRAGKKAVLRTSAGKAALFAFQYDKAARGYRIVDVATGLALGVSGTAAADGALITQRRIVEGSASQAFTLSKREGLVTKGVYRVNSTMKGARSLTADGDKARYKKYRKSATQKWYIAPVPGKANTYVIESVATGNRLAGAKGSKIKVVKAVKGAASQQWMPIFGGSGIVWKNVVTKKPLSTKAASCKEGSTAMNKSHPSSKTRQFTMDSVPAVGSGVFELASVSNTGAVLEVVGGSRSAGALTRAKERKNANYQKWTYDASAHTLTNANSGLVIGAKSADAGAAALQQKANGAATQQWTFEYVGGGRYQVVSLANKRLVLTAAPADKGASVSTAIDANGKDQKWKLTATTVTVEPVGFKLIKDIVNKGHGKLNADYIVIHETANPGATAKNHRDLWSREGYYQDYAVHYTLDWTGNCYYCVPENRLCWQVGNGNSHVIGIELCHATNKSDFKKVWNGGVSWSVWQLKKHGWGIDRLISHNECRSKWGGTDHTDPDDYFESFGKSWKQFKDAVKKALAG